MKTLILFFLLFKESYSLYGICGPNSLSPKNSSECVKYSNKTDFCCFLYAKNAIATFSSCISMTVDSYSSILRVGNMVYSIDCSAIENFYDYFPFEKDYTPCGIQNPVNPRDCSNYNIENNPCCLAATEPTFNYSLNPLCYYYPRNKLAETRNYSTQNSNGVKLYFSCNSLSFRIVYFLIFLIILLIV